MIGFTTTDLEKSGYEFIGFKKELGLSVYSDGSGRYALVKIVGNQNGDIESAFGLMNNQVVGIGVHKIVRVGG